MSQQNARTKTADDILESLMDDLKDIDASLAESDTGIDISDDENTSIELLDLGQSDEALAIDEEALPLMGDLDPKKDQHRSSFMINTSMNENESKEEGQPGHSEKEVKSLQLHSDEEIKTSIQHFDLNSENKKNDQVVVEDRIPHDSVNDGAGFNSDDERTMVAVSPKRKSHIENEESTVAVNGFALRESENYEDKVKVTVGQVRGPSYSSGYNSWGNTDSNLVQAEKLRIAQDKILELEKENEKLRYQNNELISASEIVKERAELLTSQVNEFRNDRDSLEASFKSENSVLKNQLIRKEGELNKLSMKVEELESRLKFDMKKIRVRERELENRLELIRAEKNALVKSKDEQILDFRRKMDQLQLEVESYRQKCVDLNKVIESNQDSFKRTTRALRLAMANLELLDENKVTLKKAD